MTERADIVGRPTDAEIDGALDGLKLVSAFVFDPEAHGPCDDIERGIRLILRLRAIVERQEAK